MKKTCAIALLLGLSSAAYADVVLPMVINSNMVIQRGVEAPIWGWADQGEEVAVEFAGQVKKALPDATGKWMVNLDPLEASAEPRVMTIRGNNEIRLDDVLVGEVWLAAGQSNMELPLSQVAEEERAFAAAQTNNPLVRAFHVDRHLTAGVPLDDTMGRWKDCAEMLAPPMPSVSAVGFFFALKLQQELGIPVAFIDANWGGQRIEPFIPDEGFKALGLPYRRGGEAQDSKVILARLKEIAASVDDAIQAVEKGRKVPLLIDTRIYGWAENELYNAMIAPVAPFAIRGAIWYQGEANRDSADYFQKLRALSAGWSAVFNVQDIPLYQVQIAPFQYNKANAGDTLLCDNVWKAQFRGAAEIPGMGVVAIHDTINNNIQNIHPNHKRTVGERLAAQALKKEYGRDVVITGPRFERATLEDSKVVVSFTDIDQGLTTTDGQAPSWFELSADGQSFVTAEAAIVGDKLEVHSADVPTPAFVQMGWRETAIPNLADRNGWPAFAFPARRVSNGSTNSVFLSDWIPDMATQDYGSLGVDQSVGQLPIRLGGREFEKGLGTHANSTIVYSLHGQYRRFTSLVGADKECSGSVAFSVLCDGEERFQSPVMTPDMEPMNVDVDLTGVDELKLVVTDGGNGIGCDHADWAEAMME